MAPAKMPDDKLIEKVLIHGSDGATAGIAGNIFKEENFREFGKVNSLSRSQDFMT